jgi:hypothetical protein
MIGQDKHRIMVTLTKEEMARAIQEANRHNMKIGAYLASIVRETWRVVDRHTPGAGTVSPQRDAT